MPPKNLLDQIKSFDRSSLNPTQRRIARTETAFMQLGVKRPQPNNMTRNVMLSQIETFDRSKLTAATPEQRYIVSPHKDVSNFLNNSRGLAQQSLRDNLPAVRPVFKNDKQRKDFHDMATKRLNAMGPYKSLNDDDSRLNHKAFSQLVEWSAKDNAMLDFSKVNTKRSHPIVFVQGHGSPGDKSIASDAHETASSKDVADMLHTMQLPNVSQVRANSCYSGTQHDLGNLPDARKKFQNQSIEDHAGKWGETFAGSLDENLNGLSSKRHNRVKGYMGPTTQGYIDVTALAPFGKLVPQSHTAVKIGDNGNGAYKHGNASRVNASVPGPKDEI